MSKQKPKVRNPVGMVTLHIVVICYAVYLFYTILRDYLAGGENAPTLTTLIIGAVLLLGGAVLVGVMSYRLYQQTKQEKAAEEAAKALEETGEAVAAEEAGDVSGSLEEAEVSEENGEDAPQS